MSRATAPSEAIAGRYRLAARISVGGMGEIFRARDSVLGRTVAIKVLPRDLAQRPGFVERFRREAQAAARLSHPNVVQVHDWGEWESTYYMVMEHVRGRNLRDILAARGPLAPRQACEVVAQVLDGLAAAHAQGLVHRDVKPANILVAQDGVVKVADFGIARAAEAGSATGGLFGTVAYVAPEQASGGPTDGRADLYSTGCVLYELLTGSLPFEGDAARVLHLHLTERVPPPSLERPEAGVHLDRIVIRATEPDPAARYPTASEMRDDLSAIAASLAPAPPLSELAAEATAEVPEGSEETMVPAPARRRRRLLPFLLMIGLIAAASVAGFLFRPVRVPGVLGSTEERAVRSLEAAGLDAGVSRSFSDDPPGTVISADPAPGRLVFRGSRVTLQISRGPALSDLPDLRGLPLDEAKQTITARRLVVGVVTEQHAPDPPGRVLDQDPKPGRVRRGTPVNLVVSKGPEMVEVPDVTRRSFDEALAILRARGLDAEREDVFDDAAAGTVIRQSPNPGESVEKGSRVHLVVSKGPQPFAMPDVKGKSCADAKSQLESMGLVVVVRSQSGGCGANRVLDQDPLPGATVRKGDEATLYAA